MNHNYSVILIYGIIVSWELLIKHLVTYKWGSYKKIGGWSPCKISSSKHHKHYGYASLSKLIHCQVDISQRVGLWFCTSPSLQPAEKSVLSCGHVLTKWKISGNFFRIHTFLTFCPLDYFPISSEIKAKDYFGHSPNSTFLKKKFNM